MPLYRVPGDRLINPAKVERKDVVQAVERGVAWNSFERLLKTYSEGVEWVVTNGGRITWTKTGALFGHGSPRPHKDVEHLWATIIDAVGDDRLCVIAAGTFLQLTIARRSEIWLCTARESGKVDPLTREEIFVYEYWLAPEYAHPDKRSHTAADLKMKWR